MKDFFINIDKERFLKWIMEEPDDLPGILAISPEIYAEMQRTHDNNCHCQCHHNPHMKHVIPCCSKVYEQKGQVPFDEPDIPIVNPSTEK